MIDPRVVFVSSRSRSWSARDVPGEDIPVPTPYAPEIEKRTEYWDRVFDYVTQVEADAIQRGYEVSRDGIWRK